MNSLTSSFHWPNISSSLAEESIYRHSAIWILSQRDLACGGLRGSRGRSKPDPCDSALGQLFLLACMRPFGLALAIFPISGIDCTFVRNGPSAFSEWGLAWALLLWLGCQVRFPHVRFRCLSLLYDVVGCWCEGTGKGCRLESCLWGLSEMNTRCENMDSGYVPTVI